MKGIYYYSTLIKTEGGEMQYMVAYFSEKHPDWELAVDWDWLEKKKWTKSSQDLGTLIHWYPEGKLDEEAHLVLLKHFGLLDWRDEFPIEKIIQMSPKELAEARRQKEKEHNLPHLKMTSDRLGGHVSAEECD